MDFLFLTNSSTETVLPSPTINYFDPASHPSAPGGNPTTSSIYNHKMHFNIPTVTCYIWKNKMLLLKVGSMLYIRK
jgi:hypothetical protein